MKRGMLGIIAVAAIAIGIVVYKQVGRSSREGRAPVASPVVSASPSVVLVADFSEAGTDDPCAEIIRLVRDAGARGVPVREIPSGQDSPLLREYRVTVEPTVLVVDAERRVLSRHEGESPKMIAALKKDLEKLTTPR